jgi:hypothetical protein
MSSAVPSAAPPAVLPLAPPPEELLAWLVHGDPLALRARLVRLALREAWLVDVERALLRTQSLVALHACEWRPEELEARLEDCARAALRELACEEDSAGVGEALDFCCRPLGLDARALGEACRGFNRLPGEVREAFVAAVLVGESPERSARARRLSLVEFARRARLGLELFRAHARVRAKGEA